MKIRVVVPIASDRFNSEVTAEFSAYAGSTTEISVVSLDGGPQSIESECEEALVVPDFLRKSKEAENAGYDAIICDCFGDPGVHAARELVNIPVIGAGESSMLLAAALGQRFSVVTVLRSVFTLIENLARRAGVSGKLASIRSVDMPVLELHDKERMSGALFDRMVQAVKADDAHVLILGCTGMMGVASRLQSRLAANGFEAPVIDPVGAAVKHAETMVALGIRQSHLTYHRPKAYQASTKTVQVPA
jgi:allantoin racemase